MSLCMCRFEQNLSTLVENVYLHTSESANQASTILGTSEPERFERQNQAKSIMTSDRTAKKPAHSNLSCKFCKVLHGCVTSCSHFALVKHGDAVFCIDFLKWLDFFPKALLFILHLCITSYSITHIKLYQRPLCGDLID